MPSLIHKQRVLEAGTYLIVVDVIWNDSSWEEDGFHDMAVTLHCPDILDFKEISKVKGEKIISETPTDEFIT
jgi:hypothetical protein